MFESFWQRRNLAPRFGRLAQTTVGLLLATAALVSDASVPASIWMPVARSLIPAGEADRVWDQCDADGTTQLAGAPYIGGTTHCRFMIVDGTPRRFVVYTPRTFILESPPVVLMYHGSAQHGEHFLLESTWRTLADQHGFIVAFATGLEYQILDQDNGAVGKQTKWHSYGLEQALDPAQPNWRPPQFNLQQVPNAPWPADDVSFTTAIIDDLAAQFPIDRCRIFVSGFSNGGGFVGRLAVEIPGLLAAGGAVTGMYSQVYSPSESIPMYFAQGTLDEHLLDGIERAGDPRPTSQQLLNPAIVYGYADIANRIDASTATLSLSEPLFATTFNSAPRTWLQRAWTTPLAGAGGRPELQWRLWRGVDHKYPRGPGNPRGSDNPYNFDAAVEFWNFFNAHPRSICLSPSPAPHLLDGL
jgi:poly(3-hydroxybutyrate) depolymerase